MESTITAPASHPTPRLVSRRLKEFSNYVTDGEITAHELTEVAETLVEADRSGSHTYYRRSGLLNGADEAKHRESPLPRKELLLIV